MTLEEIRNECREQARDFQDEDHLWSDSEMNRYINRVYRRMVGETRCIKDSITPAVCLLDSTVVNYTAYASGTLDYLWANDSSSWLYQKNVAPYLYKLHSSIITVEEVKWVESQWKLTKVSSEKWRPNPWWERVVGLPTEYATDYQHNHLALNFRSESSDTLQLSVTRYPLTWLSNDGDVPEIKENYHEFFFEGVLYYMYSKMDSEGFDAKRAATHKQAWLEGLDEVKQIEIRLEGHLRPNQAFSAHR